MPHPRPQDASFGWLGYVAVIALTAALVRIGVKLDGPVAVGRPNTVGVVIRGKGTVEAVAAQGRMHAPQYCSGTRCTFAFPEEAKEVVIGYEAAMGSKFQAWGGACTGSDTWCRVPLGEYKTVIVSFEKK